MRRRPSKETRPPSRSETWSGACAALTCKPRPPIQTVEALRAANVGVVRGTSWARVAVEAGVEPEAMSLFESGSGKTTTLKMINRLVELDAGRVRVLLLDEPFGALDPLTRDRLQASFDALRRRLGSTAVFVTHDVAEALALADRIGVMRAGRLVQVGTPRELAARPADGEVERLLDTPRRQARVVADRLGGQP